MATAAPGACTAARLRSSTSRAPAPSQPHRSLQRWCDGDRRRRVRAIGGQGRRTVRAMPASAGAAPPMTESDGRASARAAGLRYSTDARPGISPPRAGRGFSYRAPDGDADPRRGVLARIRRPRHPAGLDRRLDLPVTRPATSRRPGATRGVASSTATTPAGGRGRDDAKFERLLDFAAVLPRIRERCDADLATPGLPREKVLAAVVRLLELTLIRVGNDEYARLNRSFGLTTLREPPRPRRRARRSASGSAASPAASTRSGCATGGWRASSGAARTCPARSCSSTSTTTARPATSPPTTSTTTCARSRAPTSRPRTSGPGPGPSSPTARCARSQPGDDDRAAQAQRRRGRAADRRSARQHAGRRPPELRPPGDPRGLPRRLDRRRAARGGRGAGQPAPVARSARGGQVVALLRARSRTTERPAQQAEGRQRKPSPCADAIGDQPGAACGAAERASANPNSAPLPDRSAHIRPRIARIRRSATYRPIPAPARPAAVAGAVLTARMAARPALGGRPAIDDPDRDLGRGPADDDLDRAGRPAVAQGVVEQVADDVGEHHLVRPVGGGVAIAEETDVGVGVADDLALDGRDDEPPDRDRLADGADAIALGPGPS